MSATDVIDSRCIEIVKEVYEKLQDFGSKVELQLPNVSKRSARTGNWVFPRHVGKPCDDLLWLGILHRLAT
eukprot:symbB.v1.2.001341.t1/scaffold73.1/size366217/5